MVKGNNIPDFQTLMLPLLKLLGDNKIHSLNDVMERLAQHYGLTEADLRVKVPSGQMGLFRNRIG